MSTLESVEPAVKPGLSGRRIYPTCDLELPTFSPRSRLFVLQPIGIGSRRVENLTSYLMRLATEHCVSVGDLVRFELGPVARDLDLIPEHPRCGDLAWTAEKIFWSNAANGGGPSAEALVRVLEQVTTVSDLRFLTFLPFASALALKGLNWTRRAWCPECYQEDAAKGVVYDRLLWTLRLVRICPDHDRPLVSACPHCRRKMHSVRSRSRAGYCALCQGWLGEGPQPSSVTVSELLSSEERAKALFVGDLLCCESLLCHDDHPENMQRNLRRYIDAVAAGSTLRFANGIGVPNGPLSTWLTGRCKPTLEPLFQVCQALRIHVTDLLCRHSPSEVNLLKAREAFDVPTVVRPPMTPTEVKELVTALRRAGDASVVTVEPGSVEDVVRSAVREHPLVTPLELARRLGCSRSTLVKYAPDLCRELLDRKRTCWKEIVEAAGQKVEAMLQEVPPPSLGKAIERSGIDDTAFRKYFPGLVARVREVRKQYRSQKATEKRSALEKSVREEIAKLRREECSLTISAVWQRLDMGRISYSRVESAFRKVMAEEADD